MKKVNSTFFSSLLGRIWLTLLVTVFPTLSYANISWDLINTSSTSSGLPSDEVIALRFDKSDRLWASTNLAFASLTGNDWHVFGEDEGITWGKARMGRIYTDSKNNVWICSDENGLVKVDAEGKVTLYNQENGLKSNIVLDIVEDDKGGYYISNYEQFGNTLSYMDKDGNFTHYNFSQLSDNPFDNIFSMCYDADGQALYVGTLFSGVKKLQNGIFSSVSIDFQTAVSELVSDGKGKLYAASDIGLMVINTKKEDDIVLLTMADGLPDNFTTSVAIDPSGNVWVGSDGYGVAKITDTDIEIINTANGLTSNDIYTIAFDGSGNAWLGTHRGGICHQDGKGGWVHIGSTGLAGNDVSDILFDKDFTWFSTGSGISRFDGTLWKNFTFMNPEGNGLASNRVTSMIKDNREEKGKIYAAGYGGIAKYNSMFEEWEYYNFTKTAEDGSKINPKFKLFQTSNGDMWVTTFGQNLGFAKFDPEKGELTYYDENNVDAIAPNGNSFFKAVEAPDGAVWFCSVDGAIILKDGVFSREQFETVLDYENPETGEIQQGYDNNVRTVTFEENGKAWVGKISGIMFYDPVTGKKTQELGNANDPVTLVSDIWLDGEGNALISTLMSGIYVRTKNGTYFHLDEEYGLDRELMVYGMQEHDGKLYVYCENGVMITADHKQIIKEALDKENPTGISSANTEVSAAEEIYDINGIRHNALVKGLNIIKKDNKVKKVFIK